MCTDNPRAKDARGAAFQMSHQKGSCNRNGECTRMRCGLPYRQNSMYGYGTQMTKQYLNGVTLCWHRATAMPGRLLSWTDISTEHLVDKPPGTNVLHVHLETGASHKWDVQLRALLGVKATLDAVIHKCHEACCYNNTIQYISRTKAGASLVLLTRTCQYRTARSVHR
jgi:hypothetical protein